MTVDTLWFTRCPAPSAASIAIRNGWLEEEFAPDRIAVASLAAATERSVHLSHYQHTQPNSFRFGGYVPPLVTRSRGTDVRVVGLAWPDRVAEVVVAADSPIRTGADLRGRRLGVPKRLNDSIDWWRATVLAGYDEALATAGLPGDAVTLVDIPVARAFVEDVTLGAAPAQSLWGARSQFAVQREEAAALIRGEVDALYTDAAMGAILKAAYGFRPVVSVDGSEDGEYGANGFPIVLTVSGGLLDERPDLVARWLRRLLDADAWARAHEADAKRILARDTGVPEDFLDLAYSPRVHRQLDVSLSDNRVTLLRAKHDGLLRHGFLAAEVDFDSFIDPGPLRQAQAWARAGRETVSA
jgi:ABC-type nitrate/sulfonate/bicarbonate transport system substrate-binding protein